MCFLQHESGNKGGALEVQVAWARRVFDIAFGVSVLRRRGQTGFGEHGVYLFIRQRLQTFSGGFDGELFDVNSNFDAKICIFLRVDRRESCPWDLRAVRFNGILADGS